MFAGEGRLEEYFDRKARLVAEHDGHDSLVTVVALQPSRLDSARHSRGDSMLFEEPSPRLSGDKWDRGSKKDR